jgi:hypothetical protein
LADREARQAMGGLHGQLQDIDQRLRQDVPGAIVLGGRHGRIPSPDMGMRLRPIGNRQEHVVHSIHELQVERQFRGSPLNPYLAGADPRLIAGKSRRHDGYQNRDQTKIHPVVDHGRSPRR